MKTVNIGVVDYPQAMKSARYGLEELFLVASRYAESDDSLSNWPHFNTTQLTLEALACGDVASRHLDVVIVPPSLSVELPQPLLESEQMALRELHAGGSILASACVGAFLLADTGVLAKRKVTTHWALAADFRKRYGNIDVNVRQILIDDGDVITSGGLMAWMDLGMHIIQRFAGPALVARLSKHFLIDTGSREQSYYQRFQPRLSHGDAEVLDLQHWLQQHFAESLNNVDLADRLHTTVRTMQRRFTAATGLAPSHYLQQLRIQKARDLLETTTLPIEQIVWQIGYEDQSAFRKRFKQSVGLTAAEYRQRFRQSSSDELPLSQTQVPQLPASP